MGGNTYAEPPVGAPEPGVVETAIPEENKIGEISPELEEEEG